MNAIRIQTTVQKDGELSLTDLPVREGQEVDVVITLREEAAWTDEEIRQMTRPAPKSGKEIATFLKSMEPGFEHIEDSAQWVEEKRQKLRDDAQW